MSSIIIAVYLVYKNREKGNRVYEFIEFIGFVGLFEFIGLFEFVGLLGL